MQQNLRGIPTKELVYSIEAPIMVQRSPKTEVSKPDQADPGISDCWHAPFICVETAPNLASDGNTIDVTVATYRHIPDGSGAVKSDLVVTAYLKCTTYGATSLREALDSALRIAARKSGQSNQGQRAIN